jgi:hypothetical protein
MAIARAQMVEASVTRSYSDETRCVRRAFMVICANQERPVLVKFDVKATDDHRHACSGTHFSAPRRAV